MREYERGVVEAIPDSREEVDFYSAEASSDNEALDNSLTEFRQVVEELSRGNYPVNIAGQRIIHSLARYRLNFAADLPYREEELTPESTRTLELLNRFEHDSKAMLEEHFEDIFHNDPNMEVEGLIRGATAEECALRLVSQASPDSKIFYPNDEDETNGVDFFVVGTEKTLAVQVKTVHYKEHLEYKMPLMYLAKDEQDILEICDQALLDGSLDYRNNQLKSLELSQKIRESLTKNTRYTSNLAPDGSIQTALMVMSTDQINPRLSESDIDKLEASGLLPE